jgi:hypothetical protein
MSGSTLRVVDSDGREILGAIDDQPLRVRLELDVNPDSAPSEIHVDVTAADGTKRSITAERIDWGASRPLYESELTTIDGVFSQTLEVLDPILGHAPPIVGNGDVVRFGYDDTDYPVQAFDSAIDARHWITQAEISDRIGDTTNRAINLTQGLRELRKLPESEERTRLEAEIEARLRAARTELDLLRDAQRSLNNEKYYLEQRIQVARFYMTLDDPHNRNRVHAVVESSKEVAQGHVVAGMADITIGGYQMLVQSTGVAQARTMLVGENELGQEVGWDGRVVAFLDLLGDGMLQGASLKFELDHLAGSKTRSPDVDLRQRYTGPNPEKLAPEASIVDPTSMGMTPGAVRSTFRAARMHDKYVLVRPTNPDSLAHLEAGALPKPESLKSKTVGEIDTLIGMAPEARGTVGFFEPTTGFFEAGLKAGGLSDADVAAQLDALRAGTKIAAPSGFGDVGLWDKTAKRFVQRAEEYNGPTGVATRKLIDSGEIVVRDGVIYNAKSGQVYAGDHDLFDFIDGMGLPVTPETYSSMVAYLEQSAFRAQHGAHKWWDPQRSDFPPGEYGDAKFATNRGIYEKIIDDHRSGEILIVFPPVGPPMALFSGTAPGGYLGIMPGSFGPVAPGSALMLPSELRLLGIAGTATVRVVYADSVTAWREAEVEFMTDHPAAEPTDSTDAFEALAAAATARTAAMEDAFDSDEGFEPFEEQSEGDSTETDTPADAEGTAAFDELAGAAAAQSAQLDADLEADDYDPFEDEPVKDSTGSSGNLVKAGLAAAGVAVVLFLGWFLFMRDTGGDPVSGPTSTTATVTSTTAAQTTEPSQTGSTEPVLQDEPADDCVEGSGCDPVGDVGGSLGTSGPTPEEEAAGDAIAVGHRLGSQIFTLTVAGDGQAMADSDGTKWYNPRFVVAQSADGAATYIVDGKWSQGEPFDGDVLDAGFSLIPGAEVTAEWIDASTAEFTVTGLTITDAPASFVMELSIRLLQPDGSNGATFDDTAYWESG